jgi:AcrR family transcriptional regulator
MSSPEGHRTPAAAPRGDRRRARTRHKLIGAAREFLSETRYAERSVAEITEAADVGLGSFYNHFDSKDELYTAAVNEVLDEHGALLDATSGDDSDPAVLLAVAIRSSARLVLTHPEMAQILARQGMAILDVDSGLIPRVSKLLTAGIRAERFVACDPQILLTSIVGALLGGLHLWIQAPARIDDEWCDELTARLLVLCGINDAEAAQLARAAY